MKPQSTVFARLLGRTVHRPDDINVLRSVSPVFEDKNLSCRECKRSFVFTASEQEFFATSGLINEPRRCPSCRVVNQLRRKGRDPDSSAEVPCANCGITTRVPFKPIGHKPIYCVSCIHSRKETDKED